MTEDLLPAVMDFAGRASPPLAVTGSSNPSSMTYAVVELRDGHVVWRFVRERSVLRLEASPVWEPATSFDVDLLKRFLGYKVEPRRPNSDFVEAARELMTVRVKDLAVELEELRQPIASSFDQTTWDVTRRKLIDLAHRRDAELFGRPYPPDK